MEASAPKVSSPKSLEVESGRTCGEVFVRRRVLLRLRSLSVYIHALLLLLSFLSPTFPLILLALALLRENSFQILGTPVCVLGVVGVLEGACILEIR